MIRNSPAYFDTKQKDVMAVIGQLGLPTIFYSLSAADTKSKNLLICLSKLLDGTNYTEADTDKMSWSERCRLVSSHPVPDFSIKVCRSFF